MENTEDIFILLKKETAETSDLDLGLIAFWKLEENPAIHLTSIVDSSLNSNDAELLTEDGSTNKSVGGVVNNAIIFDGSNDRISIPLTICDDSTDFSFSGWVYQISEPSPSIDMGVFSLKNGTLGELTGGHFCLYVQANTSSGNTLLEIYTSGYSTSKYISVSRPPLDQWNHFVFTLSGADMKLYINGSFAGSINDNTYDPTQIEPDEAYLGRSGFSADNPFNGVLDEIRLYNRELSQAEITQLYNLT